MYLIPYSAPPCLFCRRFLITILAIIAMASNSTKAMPLHVHVLTPPLFPGLAVAVVVGVGFTMIVIDRAFVVEVPLISVTMTVKPALPVAPGVPLMTPEESSDRPDGRLPLAIDQV